MTIWILMPVSAEKKETQESNRGMEIQGERCKGNEVYFETNDCSSNCCSLWGARKEHNGNKKLEQCEQKKRLTVFT